MFGAIYCITGGEMVFPVTQGNLAKLVLRPTWAGSTPIERILLFLGRQV